MSADSPRRSSGSASRGMMTVPAIVPPQVVSDRSILDSAIGFINEVTLAHQPSLDQKDTITWARFETAADISDPRFGEDWELEGNVAPPLLLILGYGLGVQVWSIPANGEAVEVLSWRHGIVSALRVLPTPVSTAAVDENVRADEPVDSFGERRPLIALVDGNSTSGSQPQFCAVNFISLKTGAQVKTIKFKNPVIDILANRSSVVITFHERIAVFDARTLEDRLSITTCYPSPGINPNPAALGPRWLAYAENKLLHSKRSGGGCDGDCVASYTATVLNASKCLVKGLRELGEQVAAGLTGTSGGTGNSKNLPFDSNCGLDTKQSGIVTIVDIKNSFRDYSPTSGVPISSNQSDSIVAHFIAHSEALVAMEFDNSGMLLVTADRRGHDFHVFRIQPNPVGSSLGAVHHLYILHRGDTSAKVQNITLTLDSRWVAVSTLRGTTHVFPITPYGGTMGVRTHTSLHVVNKLSRFHRSAGLLGEGRSNSPISHSESTTFTQSLQPYHNLTLPPFPRPTVVMPLAQLRQPFALASPPGSANLSGVKSVTGGSVSGSQRQRLSSLSDDSGKPLSVCAIFAKSRSWLLDPPNAPREAPHRMQRKAVDSLFVMAGHGALIQYDLDTKLPLNVAKEKICDDTPIELEVEAKAQWNLGRRKEGSQEIMPPLSPDNWLIKNRNSCMLTDSTRQYDDSDDRNDSWLAQVEIITHAGPHRRLWMGPQFVFKTYNTPSGSNLCHIDIEAVEIGTKKSGSTTSEKVDHSSSLNMPVTTAGRSSAVPVLIESGSYSSIEQSPKLMDRFRHDHLDSDFSVAHGDSRLKEDLADAMRESPSAASSSKYSGGHDCESAGSSDNVAFYDALTTEDDQVYIHARSASAAALASVLPNIHSYDNSSSYESLDSIKRPKVSIEKIVNPLGTVTTITSCLTADVKTDILDEVVSQLAEEDMVIHENCDESLFRPVVAIFCDEKTLIQKEEEIRKMNEEYQPPENISNKLVVPVIPKEVDDELSKREKEKNSGVKLKVAVKKSKEIEKKNFEPKSEKTCKLNDNLCADIYQDEENMSQKSESSLLIDESKKEFSRFKNVCDKKKTGCLNYASTLKEKSTVMKNTHKVSEIPTAQVCPQKKLRIQDGATHLMESDEQIDELIGINSNDTEKVAGKRIQQKTGLRKQPQKKLQEPEFCKPVAKGEEKSTFEGRKKVETNATDETNSSSSQKDDKKTIIKTTIENIDHESINKISAHLKFTANFSSKADHIEITKNKLDNENAADNSNRNLTNNGNPTPQNLTHVNTAIKEEANKIIKDKSIVNDISIAKKQLADSFAEIKKNEKQIEDDDRNVLKDAKKIENETILEIRNPSECEKIHNCESGLNLNSEKIVDVLSAQKNEFHGQNVIPIEDVMELQEISRNNDRTLKIRITDSSINKDNRVEIKKQEKSKGKAFVCKEQNITKNEFLEQKDVNALDHVNLNNKDTNFGSLHSKIEGEEKSEKSKSDYSILKRIDSNKQNSSVSIENDEENYENEIASKSKKLKNENNDQENIEIASVEVNCLKMDDIEKVSRESLKNKIKDETTDSTLDMLKTNIIQVCKDPKPSKFTQAENCDIKAKQTQDLKAINIDFQKKELCAKKAEAKVGSNETKNNTISFKKKEKGTAKDEPKKDVNLTKNASSQMTAIHKEKLKRKDCTKKSLVQKEIIKKDNSKIISNSNEKAFLESVFDVCEKSNETVNKMHSSVLLPASAWKNLSGAEMINKNLNKSEIEITKFPCSGAICKLPTSDKLLPELPSPNDMEKQIRLDEFSILKSLDPLPPLPALEPLQLMSENKSTLKDISLINFESPLHENPALQRKITPAPRGFTEQNLILALCGSLHYENEHAIAATEKSDLSPTFSSNHSSTAFEDHSLADYKSLTENDDPYMSLEQSSQDTNTTTTNTTNEKFSSSTNSSGSEEIVIMEEKKITTKKQKRKKQQQLKEFQKEKKQQQHEDIDDEELRPLIAESHIEQTAIGSHDTLPEIMLKSDKKDPLTIKPLVHSTTTDSEDPMPATTSDDNVFSIPVPIVHNSHKIKTKKLEHKINLIAAIEAATSSSTSSAEESGVELGGRSLHNNAESLISLSNSRSTSTISLPIVATSQAPAGGLKKKTKRRKR